MNKEYKVATNGLWAKEIKEEWARVYKEMCFQQEFMKMQERKLLFGIT